MAVAFPSSESLHPGGSSNVGNIATVRRRIRSTASVGTTFNCCCIFSEVDPTYLSLTLELERLEAVGSPITPWSVPDA